MGMPLVAEYAKRFGIYDNMLPVLSMSLGAGETTVLRMVTAYATIANGGKKVVRPDRPDPGPLRPHHLQARQPDLRRLHPGMSGTARKSRP
jgi:membrane carboxypeptidase/penicillin-binding protein PbpC